MREISAQLITQTVKRLCIDANIHLPTDVKEAFSQVEML